ncbi:MAG: nitroreductase [Clostridia bacterium]|nr:nitroreductase [Clostridia bacterium]
MDVFDAIFTRRSTRSYRPDPVDAGTLDKILLAGRHAPSGSNSQLCHFLAVTDPAVIDTLAGLVQQAFSRMETTENTYISLRWSIKQSKKGAYRFCYNAPALIIIANREDYGNNVADSAVAAENIMIACNALGLGSCYINQLRWLNGDPALSEYLRSLGMAENERVYASVILGYPDTADGLPERTPLPRTGNLVTYIPAKK